MGGRLLLVVVACLLIYITGTLSHPSQEAEEDHLSLNNVRNARSASKEAEAEIKKENGKGSKKQKGYRNGKQRTKKKKNIKRKKKTQKIKNAKKIGSKNEYRKGKNNSMKNEKKKTKQHQRKQKKKNQKANKSRQSQTCSGAITPVASTCLENAQFALVFEANQVTNYLKQSKILIRHKDQTSNKKGKKGEFEEAALHMLWAVGGNISDPKCGANDSSLLTRVKGARDLASSLGNYEKLINCSAAIQEACTTPNKSYNATTAAKITLCTATMEDYRTEVAKCIDLKDSINATTQCACLAKSKAEMDTIKKLKCATKDDQKEVTQNKKACVKVFGDCKKMEDESVELVYTCMDDHSMALINQTAESLHSGAMKDTAKSLSEAEEKAKQIISGELDEAKHLNVYGEII